MNENSRVVAGALVGAVVGAMASYLFFTDSGQSFRERLEPALDDSRHEFGRFEQSVRKVAVMADEGLRLVNEFGAGRAESALRGQASH